MEKQYCSPEVWGGIECTINRVGDQFFDQLEYTGHYDREEDISLIAGLGIKKLRYPILWEKHEKEKGLAIDWSFTDRQLAKIRNENIDVIAGLVHHGSGPAFTNLSDPGFPDLLAAYAKQVATRFPWINYYTPVNEPLTTARFSGLYGLWYPHENNNSSFVRILLNELKGTVLAMQEIRKINPDARLMQTEDLGKTYSTPKLQYQARFENERRWLTFDILCGKFTSAHPLWNFFIQLGIKEKELSFFIENPCVPEIFGFNHYLTSERWLDEKLYLYPEQVHGGNEHHRYVDVEAVRVQIDEPHGIETLLREAWVRYHQPMVISEVHLHCHREEQLRWFRQVYESGCKLRAENIDLRAITSWALLGSYGWNKLLTQPGGEYEPGAFDLRNQVPRPTALAKFIRETSDKKNPIHPLSLDKGWWQRSTRLIYEPNAGSVQMSNNNSSPVLIIGKNGTLGRAFARICEDRCINYRLLSRKDCDISQSSSIEQAIQHFKPWAIINTAGYVRVDDAEHDEEACMRDNAHGPHQLALACAKAGIQLMSFSSDLVFDGKKNKPYLENDQVHPLNVYGKSKAHAEHLVLSGMPSALVIRTSAFFGPWDEYNFIQHTRKALSRYERQTVANDIMVSPTYVPHLVHAALDLLIDKEAGIWHLSNQGSASWADLAFMVADRYELDNRLIQSVSSNEIHFTAPRPRYSVLGSSRGHLLPSLQAALEEFFHHEKKENRKVA